MQCVGTTFGVFAPMFFRPGYVDQITVDSGSEQVYGFMRNVNKALLTSLVLSIISGAALLCTARQSIANRVFKAGFAGFGALATLIVFCAAAKLYYNIHVKRQSTQQSESI